MQRLKELNAKTHVTEDIGPTITIETDKQDVTTPSGSHDAIASSSDQENSLKRSPHDAAECDVKPIDNGKVEERTGTQEDKTYSQTQVKGKERTNNTKATTQGKANNSGEQQIISGGGQEKSTTAPFAAVPSTSIGSGLYVVAMHRKMVSIYIEF